GFQKARAYPALNVLTAAWADLTLLAQRHVTALSTVAAPARPAHVSAAAAQAYGSAAGLGVVLGGLVEEARAAAIPALLPAAVNDSQDDGSSPVSSAYRRQARAAECLNGALAVLAAEASQALFTTGRLPAAPLHDLLGNVRAIFPPLEGGIPGDLGACADELAAALARSALAGSAPFEGSR